MTATAVEPAPPPAGVTRRDVLRRGALAGVAVAWAVPVVQTVGMGAAAAASSACTCVFHVSYVIGSTTLHFNCFVSTNTCNCFSDCYLGATCACRAPVGATACAIPVVFTSCVLVV